MPPNAGYTIASLTALKAIAYADRSDGYARLVRSVDGKPYWYMFDDSNYDTADGISVVEPDDTYGRWERIGAGDSGGGIPTYASTFDLAAAPTIALTSGDLAYAIEMSYNTADPQGGLYRFNTSATTPALGNVVILADDSGGRWFKVAPLVHVTTVATSTYNSGTPPFAGLLWIRDTGSVQISNQTTWITIS